MLLLLLLQVLLLLLSRLLDHLRRCHDSLKMFHLGVHQTRATRSKDLLNIRRLMRLLLLLLCSHSLAFLRVSLRHLLLLLLVLRKRTSGGVHWQSTN